MTNLAKMMIELSGCAAISRPVSEISDEALRMVACPFTGDEWCDCDEIDGYPTDAQCAACKRKWLAAEAKA